MDDSQARQFPCTHWTGRKEEEVVDGSAGGRDEDRVPSDPARPDPLEATAPDINVSGDIDLHQVRQEMRALLACYAVRPETIYGFVFAVSEVTTNALRHGRPPVHVRVWSGSDRSVCTVSDHGDGPEDPVTGYEPSRNGNSGTDRRGLWMARQRCDAVSADRAPGSFTIRIISLH